MRKRPSILILPSSQKQGVEFSDPSINISNRYGEAIAAAGGLPQILPLLEDVPFLEEAVSRADGILLTGGDDVGHSVYAPGMPAKLRKKILGADPRRDWVELQVLRFLFAHRKPLLAICRGHQILNAALGGTLIVDIPTQRPRAINHRELQRKNEIVHPIRLKPGSLMAAIHGSTTLGTNSSHHQAIDRLAGILEATAWSEDGMIEAIELKPSFRNATRFLLGVQYHPERLFARHREHRKIFDAFISACRF